MEASKVRRETRATRIRRVLPVLCTVSTAIRGETTAMDGARRSLQRIEAMLKPVGLRISRKEHRAPIAVMEVTQRGIMPLQ